MKKYLKENKFIILTIFILCIVMVYFIGQKQGFHEDEIFSYGSSNYQYDNVYRSYGYAQYDKDIFYNQVLKENKISNIIKFIKNPDSFEKDETLAKEIPIFRSNEEALEYLVVNKNNIFNYFSTYINQASDVHPPLFYFLVHFISSFFLGSFSKYIIFILNWLFFIFTLFVIKKILKLFDCEHLTIPTLILYGASTACISTVMFQRMYMMLTFFSLLYLYLTIKLVKDSFIITNKKSWILTILFGFLTQYYFCIYIVLLFIIISISLLIKKEFKKWFTYFKMHLYPALIGIIFFPASIQHIFFSYRGLGGLENQSRTIFQNFIYYLNQIIKLFNFKILLILLIPIIGMILYKVLKKKIPKFEKSKLINLGLLFIPALLYILIICKMAPFLGESATSRYIMLTFPMIAIIFIYLFTFITKNKKELFIITLSLSLILSIYGFIYNTPTYLYKDNKQVLKLADKNKDLYFVYVYDNYFTHLSSLPEFTKYKSSIILNKNIHSFDLLNTDELNNSTEFILCIKGWLNQEEILNEVLKGSNYNHYELLLELNGEVSAYYYKVIKNK